MNGGRMVCLLTETLICISLVLATSASEIVPVFLEEPESAVISRHASVTLPCKVAPSSAVVRWKFNGDFIGDGDSRGFSLDQTDLRISKFRHKPKSESTEGIYQCIATTSIGSVASRPARLSRTVLRRFQGRGDLHQNVSEGHSVMLPCQPPESSPEAIISFEVNGTKLSTNNDRYRLLSSGSLMIYNVTQSDQGQYRCKATNPMTNHTRESDHVIHVQVNDSTNGGHLEGARIIFSTSVKATESQNITMECVVEGTPLPTITWEKYGGKIPDDRSDIRNGNLHIYNVTIEDTGTYVCKANNSLGSDRKAVTLEMIVAPETTAETELVTANPGESVRLTCLVTGSPVPEVIWYHNAVPITNILRANSRVTTHLIKDIVHSGAGIYQCMSSNEMGVAYSTIRVKVKGQPVNNAIDDHAVLSGGILKGGNSKGSRNKSNPAGRKRKGKKWRRKNGKRKGRRGKKNRRPSNDESTLKLVPPTHPDITQLSDTSVKLNWTVPENDGLKITFFRVQYKAIKPKRGQWRTDDTEIRGDKRMYEVAGLKPEGTYKFRIAAVYTNNDNKAGPVSERFTLKMAPYPDPQRPDGNPVIVEVRPLVHNNNYALNIKWTYQPQKKSPIEGFLLYYMKYEAEGDFHQVRLMEPTIRTYLLRNLSKGVSYNIFIKCFNSAGESNPSNRVVKATLGGTDMPFPDSGHQVDATPRYSNPRGNQLPPNLRPTPQTPARDMKGVDSSSSQSSGELLYMILGIVLGVMMLFLILFMFMCWWKQRQQRRMMEKILSADAMNDAVRCKFQDPSQRIYSDSLRKKYSNGGYGIHNNMNGGLPNGHIGNSYTRMNVSVNPLSELDDRPITNGPPHYQSLTYVPNGSVHHHHGNDSNYNKIHRSMDQCLHSIGHNNSQCLQSPDSLGSGEAPASPPSPHFHNRVPIGFNSDLNTDSQPEQYSNRSCDQQNGSHDEDFRRSYENSLSVDDSVGNAGKHKRRRKRGAVSSDNTTRDQATNTDLSSNEGTIEFSSFKDKVPSSSQISGQTSPKTVSDSEQCSSSALTGLPQRV